MDRLFLDANVLFSAAYRPDSRLRELWTRPETALVTSPFALEEARRNLLVYAPEALPALEALVTGVTVLVTEAVVTTVLHDVDLPDKDLPILSAAVAGQCTHLITGDARHFGPLYGHREKGVLVVTPSQYLRGGGTAGLAADERG